ncbi:hypothetical protein AOA79_0203725 [Helicobacter pylori]|nr:hypothetical protein AOD78_0203630 [Helicobacter pylori]OKB18836.1 hypothetical protein AOA79_0203725 [Helicobacter pylori]OKB20309.1 hypothetical protein AOD75_0205750 [Helicobacter pylori]
MLAIKTIKIPFKTTQVEIPNVFSVWALHSQNEKKLDFSSDFLSVIRGLVGMLFQNPLLSFTAKSKTIPPSK